MIKGWLIAVLIIPVMVSCTPNAGKSFHQLESLKGNWVSAGGVKVYCRWQKSKSSLNGLFYSLQNADTLFLNRLKMMPQHDTLFLTVQSAKGKMSAKRYRLTKSCCDKFVFKAEKEIYPFKITFAMENDTLWKYRQENIRGNKTIIFDLKKITP